MGYLTKDIRASDLRAAVKSAASGQIQFSPSASASVLDAVQPPELQQPLTQRERDILRLMVKGYSHKEIAHALKIIESTAKTHLRTFWQNWGCQTEQKKYPYERSSRGQRLPSMSKIATCATPGFTIPSVLLPRRGLLGKQTPILCCMRKPNT